MESILNKQEINKFWDWFYKNSQNFGDKFENKRLLAELEARVTRLGPFSWEVGPCEVEKNALVISPNGDQELLKYSKAVVAYAKPCPDWEFHYSKPPKKWDLKFDFKRIEGKNVPIDPSPWQYMLAQYEDETFEIIIKSTPLLDLNDDDKLSVAEIVLDGILGEEVRIEQISYIDVVDEFEDKNERGATSITFLASHLASLQ